jgi:hypothetical protein
MAVTIDTLIRNQQRDIADFRASIASLEGKPEGRLHIRSLQFRIAQAERAIANIEAAQWQHA